MLPRNKKLRFHRLNGKSMNRQARPRLGGLTLSFYSLALFLMICGGQVSVSHSAPIPRHWHASGRFIPREVQSDQPFTSFEMNMRKAAGANSQYAAGQGILSGLKRMIADLAHAKNELVLALLALPLVLYFVGLSWMASSRSDNKGKSKKQKLQHFGHKGIFKPYLITLGTGMLSGSGCKSDVLMKLYGTSGSTPYYNLSRMSRESGWLNPCRRGAQSGFVIWTRNIGELTAVQIQLDNKHIQENPKWLLDFVRVTDCQEDTQKTWLVNILLRGAGPHILNVRSAQLQPVVRYMAVNMLRGLSRLSVWNVWTLLKEDTSLGAVSSLSLCLLFIVNQMALSSILLYLLPDQIPTFASTDTLLQTLDTYGVGLSHKDILLQLAAGTVAGTALLWVLETILRYASKKRSSCLTKSQLRHIRKAIKQSKNEEDRMDGKNEVVKKMQINKKTNVPKEPLLVADKGVKGKVPSSKDIDKKSDGSVNPDKVSSSVVPTSGEEEMLETAKNTAFPNEDQASKNVQEAVDDSKNALQTTSNARKVQKQDPKENLNVLAQDQQYLNAKLEEFKTGEISKEVKVQQRNECELLTAKKQGKKMGPTVAKQTSKVECKSTDQATENLQKDVDGDKNLQTTNNTKHVPEQKTMENLNVLAQGQQYPNAKVDRFKTREKFQKVKVQHRDHDELPTAKEGRENASDIAQTVNEKEMVSKEEDQKQKEAKMEPSIENQRRKVGPGDQASENVQKGVDGSKNGLQTTDNTKQEPEQDSKGSKENLNVSTQGKQSQNVKVDRFKIATRKKFLEIKVKQSDHDKLPTVKKPGENASDVAKTLNEKGMVSKEEDQKEKEAKIEPSIHAIEKQTSNTVCKQDEAPPAPRDMIHNPKDMTQSDKVNLVQHERISTPNAACFLGKQQVVETGGKNSHNSLTEGEKRLFNVLVKTLLDNVCRKIKDCLNGAHLSSLDVKKLACVVVKAAVDTCLQNYQEQGYDGTEVSINTLTTVANLTNKVSRDASASSIVCTGDKTETAGIPKLDADENALEILDEICNGTNSSGMQNSICLAGVASDSLKVALKESVADCVATLSATVPLLSWLCDEPEQTKDSKTLQPVSDKELETNKDMAKQEKDSTRYSENHVISSTSNCGMQPVLNRTLDNEANIDESNTVKTERKETSKDEQLVQYINEIQPYVPSKRKKSIISKMNKAFKRLTSPKDIPHEKTISTQSLSSFQPCVLNIINEMEVKTDLFVQNPSMVSLKKKKTPMQRVMHKLRKLSSTSLHHKEDSVAPPCPPERTASEDEDKNKLFMAYCDRGTDGAAAAQSCIKEASSTGTKVKEQIEKIPVLSFKGGQPDELKLLTPVNQKLDTPVLAKQPRTVGQIPLGDQHQTQLCKEQQADRCTPFEDSQADVTSHDKDHQAKYDASSPIKEQRGNELLSNKGQQASESSFDKEQQTELSSPSKDQPPNESMILRRKETDESVAAKEVIATGTGESTDMVNLKEPVKVVKPGAKTQEGGNSPEDIMPTKQTMIHEMAGEKVFEVVHKCGEAIFSSQTMHKLRKKIIRKMLFHVGEVAKEGSPDSKHVVTHKVLVALNNDSFTCELFTNILETVTLELKPLQQSSCSCTCGLLYQIGCHVLGRKLHMKEAIGLDVTPLESNILETELELACSQEARDVVDIVIRQNQHQQQYHGSHRAKITPGMDHDGTVSDEPEKQHKASVAAAVEMVNKFPSLHKQKQKREASIPTPEASTMQPVSLEQSPSRSKSTGHSVPPEQSQSGTKSTGQPYLLEQSPSGFKSTGQPVSLEQSQSDTRSTCQPVSPELSVSACKSTDAKAARASSSMDDAAIIPVTPNTSVTTTEEPDEREVLKANRAICKQNGMIRKKSHKPGKKRRTNENQNCFTGKVCMGAPNELVFMELVMEEEGKTDSMLNVGDLLVQQDYVDQALLNIENQLTGTTPTNLPVLVSYITYVLIALLCLLAVLVTVLFGAALSPHKAAMWLVYTVTGLIWHMLVLEPLKVLVVVFSFSMRRKFLK